ERAHGVLAMRLACESCRAMDEIRARRERADQVDRTEPEEGGKSGCGAQRERAAEDDLRSTLRAHDERKHWNARRCVVRLVCDRKAPEVRRRPQKQHEREQPWNDAGRRI